MFILTLMNNNYKNKFWAFRCGDLSKWGEKTNASAEKIVFRSEVSQWEKFRISNIFKFLLNSIIQSNLTNFASFFKVYADTRVHADTKNVRNNKSSSCGEISKGSDSCWFLPHGWRSLSTNICILAPTWHIYASNNIVRFASRGIKTTAPKVTSKYGGCLRAA